MKSTIIDVIARCDGYEQLARICYRWAKDNGVILRDRTYEQLAADLRGGAQRVFLAAVKKTEELERGFEMAMFTLGGAP